MYAASGFCSEETSTISSVEVDRLRGVDLISVVSREEIEARIQGTGDELCAAVSQSDTRRAAALLGRA
jgi:hypothetical protein